MVTDISGWGNDNTLDYVIEPGTSAATFANNSKPVAAGSAEGGPIVAWLSDTGVEVQFLDVLGEPTVAGAEVASRVIVSEGADFKSNVRVADGVAAIAVGWEEASVYQDPSSVQGPVPIFAGQIKLQGLGPEGGLPFGATVTVGAEQNDGFDNSLFSNHSMVIAGYDFTTSVAATPANGNRPNFTVTASGINVAWVASAPGDTSGFGQIMLQRYQIVTDDAGEPAALVAAGIDGQVEATATRTDADRAALGVADDNAKSLGEGRDPVVTGLHTGETLVAWIDENGNVKAQLFPPNGVWLPSDLAVNGLNESDYIAVNAALQTGLGAVATDAPSAAHQMQVVQLGAGNFAVMWIGAASDGSLQLQGTYFALPPDLAAEVVLPGGDGWTPIPIAPIALPKDFTGEFNLSGMGEDNPDIVVTFTANDGDGTGIFAVHVDGNATGALDQVFQHSDAFLVNTSTAGNQSGGSVAGTVGDRAIITYLDEDSGDVLARMVDLREPGQFIQGDRIRDRDDSASLNAGDRIQGRADILIGTAGADAIIGDLPDPALGGVSGVRFDNPEGLDDQLFGGLGNDVIYGGGGNDLIDGGRDLSTPQNRDDPELGGSPKQYTDTAVYQGNALDYAIWVNGDGSYSIVDAHFDDGGGIVDEIRATGIVNLDGLDLVANVEQFVFLNGDGQALYKLGFNGEMPSTSTHVTVAASNFYSLPDQDHRLTGNVALDRTADSTPTGIETVETPVGWGLTQDTADHGFAITGLANVSDGIESKPLVAKTEDSFVAAWQTTLHLTVYDQFMDPVPTAAGTAVIDVTSNVASVPPALASAGAGPVIAWVALDGDGRQHLMTQAYDANGAALGPATGLHVNADGVPAGTTYSSLSVLATGLRDVVVANPIDSTDAIELDDQFAVVWIENADRAGYGNIAIQRYVLPLANDGVTVEAPIKLGLDGSLGGGPASIGVGRNVQAAGLEDGHLLLTWVDNSGGAELVRGTVLSAIDGHEEMPIDLSAILAPHGIAADTNPMITSAGEADILVSWLEADPAGGFTIKGAYYKSTGPSTWDQAVALDLKHFATATAPAEYSVLVVGESTEDIIVTWRGDDGTGLSSNDVHGQRYGVDGTIVGHTFDITSGQTDADASSTAGLLDGRFVVAHTQQDGADVDIRARVFDTNNAIDPVIERDAGGPRGAEPGTIFDDIIDGRDREDVLHGGLGNDVLIGGVNDDTLFGDSGNDVLIGGSGTDILLGDVGDDVLMGGYGRDYISGGAGVDTLSYKGESRSVSIDLAAGIVRSDAQHNAVVLPAAGSIAGLPAAAFTDAGIEDLIGRIAIDPITEVETFTSEAGSIENAEGSLGNDIIRGTTGANVLTGLAGDDVLDGRDGDDTAVFRGNGADYTISANGDGSFIVRDSVAGRDGTDTVISVEHLQFADASLDIGSFVALNDVLSVEAGRPVTLNVLNNDVGAGLHVISVNGTPVTPNGTLVLGNGSLSLMADGTALQFTPNAGFSGAVDFNYTIANVDGLLATANVHLDVKANMAPSAVVVENVATMLETNGVAAVDSKVGDIVITDDGMGVNVITLAGADAALFRVIGSELFLQAGALLDTELKSSYSVHIAVSDPALGGPAVGTDFTLAIGNVNEAPTSVALSATSVLENTVAGTVVGTLSAIDPDLSDKVGFELTDAAGGAFALLGEQIVVANPTLLDFEVGKFKTVAVLASDAGGLQLSKDITIAIADIAENVLTGTAGANTLNGGGGNDVLAGLAGDDTLNGNAGNDVLDGGAGKDNMAGGAGDDTYVVDNSGDKVTESSGQGTDTVVTTLSNYTLATNVETLTFAGSGAFQGRGNESNNLLFGGATNDQLQGDKGNDTLVGDAGSDTLDGGDGNDVLAGGQGSDSLIGGKGSDRLDGGAGNDVLSGGNDADVFVFRPGFGADVITDFAAAGTAHDMLELTSRYHSLADLQAAHAISQVGADTVITLNSDPAHLDQITLRGVAANALTADHFWFF